MIPMIIMVQMADRNWTMRALHEACSLARRTDSQIALVRMMLVQHVEWLGTALGETPPIAQAYRDLEDYKLTAEDYGVTMFVQPMQYAILTDALLDAAHDLDAQIVFATLPPSAFALWRSFNLWWLEHQLNKQDRLLYTLEEAPTGIPLPGSLPHTAH